MAAEPLLEVVGLTTAFPTEDGGWRAVVNGVSFSLAAGERIGLVGESGSGKSLTALAILGLAPEPGVVRADRVVLDGRAVAENNSFRGGGIGLVFQEGGSALNPVYSVGYQLVETIRHHRVARGEEARKRALDLLGEVAFDRAELIFRAYPHQLSGGQAQRVMLALALAGEPQVLIADEPTTALDVITQAQILELLTRITDERGTGLLLVSHDLAVIGAVVHRVLVMDAGSIVEEGAADTLFSRSKNPVTRRLADAAIRRHQLDLGSGPAPS
jgi:ABC-type dipeptide/oligopeptide/nickel transport system ATPase component